MRGARAGMLAAGVAAALLVSTGLSIAAADAAHGPPRPGPSRARPSAVLPVGAILFRSGRSVDGRVGLHAVDARGGVLKELGLTSGWEAHWSPDGRRIAFSRSDGGDWEDVYVVEADGTGLRLVARIDSTNLSVGQLAWSPGGRRIAFTDAAAPDSTNSVISVVGVDGRRRTRLTRPGRASDNRPTWSSDGRWIAFVRDARDCEPRRGVCGGLFLVSSDGKRLRRLPTGSTDGVIGRPSWSRDGRRLAFALCCEGGAYVIDVDGTHRRPIVNRGTVHVTWSPNGRWIALVGGDTHVVRPDGSGYRRISTRGIGTASWSPDSQAVVVEDECCAPDIWVLPIDDSGERRLTEGWRYGYGNYDPEWNPRGLPTAGLGGAIASPANPTDSVVTGDVLRATRPVVRLSADGSRVAAVYASEERPDGAIEVWNAPTGSITRFSGLGYSIRKSPGFGSRGFALAGERVAATSINSGGGIDSWTLSTATLTMPRGTDLRTTSPGWPSPCCSTPLEHVEGDRLLLVVDAWGPCRISQSHSCAREPKFNGRLIRVNETRVTEIAADRGPLTLLSVDSDRILVDRENGALQLFRADGTLLYAVTYGPARLLGAKLEGNDLVALTTEGLSHYDAGTGDLRHHRRLTAADAQLADVQNGVAVYLSGTEILLHRLSDGREAVIRPEGRGPVLAELEAPGLFYSYTADDPKHPGRVAFVPFDQLPLR